MLRWCRPAKHSGLIPLKREASRAVDRGFKSRPEHQIPFGFKADFTPFRCKGLALGLHGFCVVPRFPSEFTASNFTSLNTSLERGQVRGLADWHPSLNKMLTLLADGRTWSRRVVASRSKRADPESRVRPGAYSPSRVGTG